MTSISNMSQNLQHGLTNPEYLRVLNKSYPPKRKYSKGMKARGIQGKVLARIKINICKKAY